VKVYTGSSEVHERNVVVIEVPATGDRVQIRVSAEGYLDVRGLDSGLVVRPVSTNRIDITTETL
jgi:hypothetical protein